MLKSGLLLSGGNITVSLLGLVRNVVVARLVSVEDFGIASTFAITMALIEMSSSLSIDRLLVQAADGEDPKLQNTAHAVQAARGGISAIFLFLIADPLAALFGVPEIAWAYQLLAVMPLLVGFQHLDMVRQQRQMRFMPYLGTNVASLVISTAAIVPLAYWYQDFRTLLFAILLQQTIFTGLSHIIAERRYRWAWDRETLGRAVNFGWPLLLNGILMFGMFQGDRIIVGSLIGMADLGWYSAAFTLTITPTLVVARTLQTFFLPLLGKSQNDGEEFLRLSMVTIQAGMLAGAVFAVGFALAGAEVLIALYGEKYAPALAVLTLLAVMQGTRIAKAGPAIVAIARAETRIPLIGNILRILALPAAWYAVQSGSDITTIIWLAIVGEIAAFAVSAVLLVRWLSLDLTAMTVPVIACAGTLALVGVDNVVFADTSGSLRLSQVFLVVTVPVVFWSMPALRNWLISLFQTR